MRVFSASEKKSSEHRTSPGLNPFPVVEECGKISIISASFQTGYGRTGATAAASSRFTLANKSPIAASHRHPIALLHGLY
jgi:hypothetical protein